MPFRIMVIEQDEKVRNDNSIEMVFLTQFGMESRRGERWGMHGELLIFYS